MLVAFAGSGGAVVTEKRACACVVVDDEIILDCGSGSLKNLRLLKIDLTRPRTIAISHGHSDHITDFVQLLWAMQLDFRSEPLEVLAPGYVIDACKKLLRVMSTPPTFLTFKVNFIPLRRWGTYQAISSAPTTHSVEAYCYRVERQGSSVCYTGDTAYSENVVKLARRCDVLIHECPFLNEEADFAARTMHSTAGSAGMVAREAEVEHLVLYHVSLKNGWKERKLRAQAAEAFGGKVTMARDLLKIRV